MASCFKFLQKNLNTNRVLNGLKCFKIPLHVKAAMGVFEFFREYGYNVPFIDFISFVL